MIKSIEATGSTEEEAINSALRQLGMSRDDVSIEILDRGKKGFLGFGTVPAKVRLSYEVEDPKPAEPKPEAKRPEKPAPSEPKPEAKKSEPVQRQKKEQKPAQKQAQKQAPSTVSAAPAENTVAHEPKATAPKQPETAVKAEGEPPKAKEITDFLTGLFEHMDVSAEISISQGEENTVNVELSGENIGALIGRRGETLDAIQHLTNYVVNSENGHVRVNIDAENYRAKRTEALISLAKKVAAKVVRYRRNVTLEPMNAYERHVIHTALQDYPGVTTYSTGSEPNRRIVVAYDRATDTNYRSQNRSGGQRRDRNQSSSRSTQRRENPSQPQQPAAQVTEAAQPEPTPVKNTTREWH